MVKEGSGLLVGAIIFMVIFFAAAGFLLFNAIELLHGSVLVYDNYQLNITYGLDLALVIVAIIVGTSSFGMGFVFYRQIQTAWRDSE